MKLITRRLKTFLIAIFAITLCSLSARATNGLIGSSVTGALYFQSDNGNFFDPNDGEVPAGYLNTAGTTVTISAPNTEFGFDDGGNTDSANFSSQLFVVEDAVSDDISGINTAFTMTFTDTAFSGLGFTLVQDNFPLGVTDSLVGDELTVNFPAYAIVPGDDYTAAFKVAIAVTPEPSTWAMLMTGMAACVGLTIRRRRQGFAL